MDRIPLAYAFGNHMHWVDMEWLWGYHVLPGSVRDMIRLCHEAGVKGCVNFDGIGYEKLAVENPEAFAELREAVRSGQIEIVGASYGQPYGLFHGGESNIRQRIYGVRTCMRLFGVRPRTFWEEEFDFFPQLPQILAGCGFTGASLYFQWTWHTPEIPREDVPVILWEGLDGTRIPTATRNRLNLHQWPEDMDILLKELVEGTESAKRTAKALHRAEGEGMIDRDDIEDTAITIAEGAKPLILQWLELMPSPDWMCRSEVILPKLRELLEDPRFDIERVTLGEYLASNAAQAPVRRYGMHEVWHGMTLGKNGDAAPRRSREIEQQILAAESLQAIISIFGRPYPNWDVYPTWELEEAWRNLLMAQHHDNHECEGLCGHVAEAHFKTAEVHAQLGNQALNHLLRSISMVPPENVVYDPVDFSYEVIGEPGVARANIDFEKGVLPFAPELSLPRVRVGNQCLLTDRFESHSGSTYWSHGRYGVAMCWGQVWPTDSSLDLTVSIEDNDLQPGMNAGARVVFPWTGFAKILADTPYGIEEVRPGRPAKKKYPTGDWMTSPQWFETVENHFTSQSFVDFVREDGSGILVVHYTNQQWFYEDYGLENLVAVNDPWDEDRADRLGRGYYDIVPHGPMSNADRWALARTCLIARWGGGFESSYCGQDPRTGRLPRSFRAVSVDAPNVVATAFYREIEEFSGRGLESYAGQGMGYPFILRLVEFDGIAGDVEVTLPGPIAKAVKTNLMGERAYGDLEVKPGDPYALIATPEELEAFGIRPETITVPMQPYEIATIYLDLVPGRKVARDLDAKREIWATVHRTES